MRLGIVTHIDPLRSSLTVNSPTPHAAFGDSNAASIVDGGIGRAIKSTNIASNGIDADDGTLRKLSEGESFGNSNLGKNY